MIVTRFCSIEEYNKFINGETLNNSADHYNQGKGGSLSKGFCFTTDEPKVAWKYLKGIVSYDICMILEFDEGVLTESKGKYIDHYAANGYPIEGYKTEYYTTEYSNKCARLLRTFSPEEFATPDDLAALEYLKMLNFHSH